MSTSTPKIFFQNGWSGVDYTQEQAIRAFEPLRPYPQNTQVIVYRTRFMQLRASYTRPAANTAHPDLPQVYFQDDIDFQDRTSGLVEWTRVYTTLPTSWNDYESDTYQYPGIVQIFGTLIRQPQQFVTTHKVTRDYYAVGTLPTYSQRLTNGDTVGGTAWTQIAANVNTNAVAVPACAGGGTFATVLSDDATTNGIHCSYQGSLANLAIPGAVFLKANTCSIVRVALAPAASVAANINATYATFNLATGQVVDSTADVTPRMAAVGDGWWRACLEYPNTSQTNVALVVALCNASGNASYDAFVTPLKVYAWRGQMPSSGNTVPHATIPPTVAGDGVTNYPITSADLIPQATGLRYYFSGTAVGANIAIDCITSVTTPNIVTWNGYVTADTNSNSYSVEATDSIQSLWNGSVWERKRNFVKAR